MKIYINGRYCNKAEAAVSVFDHGLLYGDGIFEGLRIYGGKVFRLEAVMLNRDGFVAECTADNIFIVVKNGLFAPAPYHGALDGITMQTVKEIAAGLHIGTHQTALTQYDLYNADECFMTGTGAEIMPIIRIDGRTIGAGKPGEVTRQLRERFRQTVATGHSLCA